MSGRVSRYRNSKRLEFRYQNGLPLNHTKWKDYLTLAFWTIQDGGIPALTMGISVKNPARYQSLLYFLEFAEFDLYMIDNFEKIDSKFDLLSVLTEYGNDNN